MDYRIRQSGRSHELIEEQSIHFQATCSFLIRITAGIKTVSLKVKSAPFARETSRFKKRIRVISVVRGIVETSVLVLRRLTMSIRSLKKHASSTLSFPRVSRVATLKRQARYRTTNLIARNFVSPRAYNSPEGVWKKSRPSCESIVPSPHGGENTQTCGELVVYN